MTSPDNATVTLPTACDACDDDTDELYLHSRCHPDAPTWTVLHPAAHRASVRCSVCDEFVAGLHVSGIVGMEG